VTAWLQYEARLRVDHAPAVRLTHSMALSHSAGAATGLTRVDALLERLPRSLSGYGLARRRAPICCSGSV
jgi:predicted RNA polymerase sigma factor